MSEEKKRYVKLHWQAVAGIVKKATGMLYSGTNEYRYRHSNSFYCREESTYSSGRGGVRILYNPVRDNEGKLNKEAADATLAKMVRALQDAGYAVDHKPGNYTLVVTKEAPPAPPKQPFRFVHRERIANFDPPLVEDSSEVSLYRIVVRTHAGDFPQDEWVVELSHGFGGERETMTLHGYDDAAREFGMRCQVLTSRAARRHADEHGSRVAPSEDEIAALTPAWEAAMAAYKEQYPGPEPEIAR